jgi:1,4-alpha-glucan branching enzyme
VVQNARLPDGSWKQVFNSDSDQYGGWSVGNFGATIPSSGGSFNANIPACGLVVFQKS